MAPPITNPFSITYGTFQVGGNTDYQLVGPYVIEKTHDEFRLVFEVIIAATSYSNLQTLSNNLEAAFRARLLGGQTLIINLSGSSWTYTMGSNLLKATAQITKTGKPETDRGYSRSYAVTITGQMPADQTSGLRDIEVMTQKPSNRQCIVSMRGTYTANSGSSALSLYTSGFDAEAATYLTAIKGSATWELVDETFALDREKSGGSPFPHLCIFTRQYVELLFNQSTASLDDAQIRDHKVTFTNMNALPGDSKQGVRRLQRVVGTYDCAVDVNQTLDLMAVYKNKIRAHIKQTFATNFSPTVFAMEEERVGYDETANRISVSLQFVFQPGGGEALVEMSQSVAFRETRQLDYTPVHTQDEFAANADVGFAVLERIWTRLAVVVGDQSPQLRIAGRPNGGLAGQIESMAGQQSPDSQAGTINAEGWNIINATSEVRPIWIGSAQDEFTQFQLSSLTETVTERYHRKPTVGTSAQIPIQGPITPGGGRR
jgi:hypothetical protein